MDVSELARGLWRWTGDDPGDASVYCETGGAIVLVDPLLPADPIQRERFWRALDRDVERVGAPVVLLTSARHVRATGDVLERYAGGSCWCPEPAGAAPQGAVAFQAGAALPGGVVAVAGLADDVLLWLPEHGSLATGHTVVGAGDGLRLAEAEAERTARLARELASLPVERVVPTHGEPVLEDARAALARLF